MIKGRMKEGLYMKDSLGREILSWILDIGIVIVAVLLITTFVFSKDQCYWTVYGTNTS